MLAKKVSPIKPVEEAVFAQRIAALASADFKLRDSATKALAELGDVAGPALRHALAKPANLEMQRRLENLVKALRRDRTAAELQQLRAVAVLELIGSAASKRVLQDLASGAPGSRLTQEAKAALARVAGKTQQ
jgi:hypothetical protein